jgi:hypothetical protein
MSTEIDLQRKDLADEFRENHPEFLCSEDDARMTAVTFNSDAPQWLLEDARRQAADYRGEIEGAAGQVGLSDQEKQQIDFSKERASVPHARSVKGIAASEGVDDWLAFFDPTLTVDEHRDVMTRAAREGGGRRMDSEDSAAERAGRAARTAAGEECNHAEGHCRNGKPDACEFLRERCGYEQDEIQEFLSGANDEDETVTVGEGTEQLEVAPETAGALKRSWQGYSGGVEQFKEAFQKAIESWRNAQAAAKAINEIRSEHGQDGLEFTELQDQNAELVAFVMEASENCLECHAGSYGRLSSSLATVIADQDTEDQ